MPPNANACQHQHPPPTNAANTNTNADATNAATNVTPTTYVANNKTQGPNDELVIIWAPGIFFIVHLLTNHFFCLVFYIQSPAPHPSQCHTDANASQQDSYNVTKYIFIFDFLCLPTD
jgi:hypothetical protein